jgi:hypothetical protein
MARLMIPAWWRVPVVGAALAVPALFVGQVLPVSSVASTFLALGGFVVAPILGGCLAVGMMRATPRDRLAALAGIAGAVAFGVLSRNPAGVLLGLGLTVPLALLLARPDPVPSGLASAGVAGWLVALVGFSADRGPPAATSPWLSALAAASGILVAAGFGAYAWRTGTGPSRAPSRRARLALVLAGAALLVLSFIVGGHWLIFPLWPAALAMLLLPALSRWRAWPAGAGLVVAVALVGAFPVATCTADPWSDAIVPDVPPDADAHPQRVALAELAGNGPRWASGDGFSGESVRCGALPLALGAAWGAILASSCTWVTVRRDRPLSHVQAP